MTSETPCLPGCHSVLWKCPGVPLPKTSVAHTFHAEGCPNAPKPAEPPACKCGHGKTPHEMDDSCGECTASGCACDRYDPKQEPQSEPPIDWDAAERWATERAGALAGLGTSPDLNLSKSYLALKAENAALKVRVGELSESLLWATSSYEERVVILANREKRKEQEASNGK